MYLRLYTIFFPVFCSFFLFVFIFCSHRKVNTPNHFSVVSNTVQQWSVAVSYKRHGSLWGFSTRAMAKESTLVSFGDVFFLSYRQRGCVNYCHFFDLGGWLKMFSWLFFFHYHYRISLYVQEASRGAVKQKPSHRGQVDRPSLTWV